eukprot:TRINITY_DN12697_c0_g2_i2.p1 TRINITY_DN12697_c0_g2~~TRINITY_DN12697_c0_g2_i2.p1  ORF type:complete len:459 (-),score=93.45 TRINITY_DN12697_c0_g2_i2:171-1547(-)
MTEDASTVKLSDFGEAGYIDTLSLREDKYVGSPQWMAPERLRLEDFDFKSDIWSFGCTLVELCRADPPYGSDHSYFEHLKIQVQAGEKHGPDLEGLHLPATLSQFLQRCFQPELEVRASAAELQAMPFVLDVRRKQRNDSRNSPVLVRVQSQAGSLQDSESCQVEHILRADDEGHLMFGDLSLNDIDGFTNLRALSPCAKSGDAEYSHEWQPFCLCSLSDLETRYLFAASTTNVTVAVDAGRLICSEILESMAGMMATFLMRTAQEVEDVSSASNEGQSDSPHVCLSVGCLANLGDLGFLWIVKKSVAVCVRSPAELDLLEHYGKRHKVRFQVLIPAIQGQEQQSEAMVERAGAMESLDIVGVHFSGNPEKSKGWLEAAIRRVAEYHDAGHVGGRAKVLIMIPDCDIRRHEPREFHEMARKMRFRLDDSVELIWDMSGIVLDRAITCLLYTSPSPRDS